MYNKKNYLSQDPPLIPHLYCYEFGSLVKGLNYKFRNFFIIIFFLTIMLRTTVLSDIIPFTKVLSHHYAEAQELQMRATGTIFIVGT